LGLKKIEVTQAYGFFGYMNIEYYSFDEFIIDKVLSLQKSWV